MYSARLFYIILLISGFSYLTISPIAAQTTCPNPYPLRSFFISPIGNDANSGISQSTPIKTFSKAWQLLCPGDTLYLMDGTYTQTMAPNVRSGQPGNFILIKALNDGRAVIDGQGARIPVSLGGAAAGYFGVQYYLIEGIVAKNSSSVVYHIEASNNTLRRVSGYNANADGNDPVFLIWGNHNLIEDCVASGTGRKMIMSFSATGNEGNNIIRRCVADWHDWRGLNWCSGHWPWGDEVQIYHGHDNIIENTLAIGSHSGIGINIQNQSGGSFTVNNNQVLGSIVTNAGMDPTNQPSGLRFWGTNPPQVDPHTWDVPNPNCSPWSSSWGGIQRSGFSLYGSHMFNTVFKDILATNNAGSGLALSTATNFSGTVDHATLVSNGLDTSFGNVDGTLNAFTVTNSYIPGTSHHDPAVGARLTQRYVNGQLTTQNLWPWPMEERIKAEYAREFGINNFSVTCTVGRLINQYTNYPITTINVNDYCNADTPPSPTPIIGDLDADSDVDFLDLLQLMLNFNTSGLGNFNSFGLVDIFDLNALISHL